jgi:hypothetical protein
LLRPGKSPSVSDIRLVRSWKTNYMHLRTSCLELFDGQNQRLHVMMTNSEFMKLQEEEALVLEEKGFLVYIIANKM